MHMRHALTWSVLFLGTLGSVSTLEIFITKTAERSDDGAAQTLAQFANKSYHIPLFKTRYLTIRLTPNDLRRNANNDEHDVVGFKFQIKSTDPRVLDLEKIVPTAANVTEENHAGRILLEDLFILPGNTALGQVLNAYPTPTLIQLKNRAAVDLLWSMTGARIDETTLTFVLHVFHSDGLTSKRAWTLEVLVTQPQRLIDRSFYVIMPVLVILISVQMGILLDTSVLIDLVKKPKPVLIGFVSQYGLMPFLAMGIAKLFKYTPLNALALFVIGCCPGSGASNQWTLLFDGDINLSAVMSFVSTASSFVMMPLYFYTLGRIYMDELAIRVPFLGLVRTLALVVVPYSIGIVISHYSSRTRSIVERLVKPMMLFLLIFFLIFGTIVNWYLITMIDLYTALTAPLLPYLGFLFGALLAYVCRLDWIHVKTIGIEAGIQNVGIAFMIIFYSFPQPYATKAIVVPLVVAFLTTKPFWLVYVIRNRVKRWKASKAAASEAQKPSVSDEPSANKKEAVSEMMQNL